MRCYFKERSDKRLRERFTRSESLPKIKDEFVLPNNVKNIRRNGIRVPLVLKLGAVFK